MPTAQLSERVKALGQARTGGARPGEEEKNGAKRMLRVPSHARRKVSDGGASTMPAGTTAATSQVTGATRSGCAICEVESALRAVVSGQQEECSSP